MLHVFSSKYSKKRLLKTRPAGSHSPHSIVNALRWTTLLMPEPAIAAIALTIHLRLPGTIPREGRDGHETIRMAHGTEPQGAGAPAAGSARHLPSHRAQDR